MKLADVVLLAGVLAALALAVCSCIRNRKSQKRCGGDCSACGYRCSRF